MIRAVLFDLGGTLYDYRTHAHSQLEALVTVARAHGIEQEPRALARVYHESLRQVFHDYLPRPFYLHRDLFRDALAGMLAHFGQELRDEFFSRHQKELEQSQTRDLQLRAGVIETLGTLRSRGLRLGIVSDIDNDALERSGGLAPEVLFVGDTTRQDVEGANRAGMHSVLLWQRSDREPPARGPRPRYVIRRIPELLELVQ